MDLKHKEANNILLISIQVKVGSLLLKEEFSFPSVTFKPICEEKSWRSRIDLPFIGFSSIQE